jgi:hypothetical protein
MEEQKRIPACSKRLSIEDAATRKVRNSSYHKKPRGEFKCLDDVRRQPVAVSIQSHISMNGTLERVIGIDPFDEIFNRKNISPVHKHISHNTRVEYN